MAERYTRIRSNQIRNVLPDDIDATNAPSDDYVPSYDLATGKFTWIAAGGGGVSNLQEAFDGGQSIIVGDGDNQKLVYTNNDITNNPNCIEIVNNCSGAAIEIAQNGKLAGSVYSLNVTSTAVQDNDNWLAYFGSTNASSTHGLLALSYGGVLAGGKHALQVYSAKAHVNADSALVKIHQDNASASEPALEIDNDGSGAAIEISSDIKFLFAADATDPTGGGGAATGRIKCLIGGVTRYLAYY